MSHTRAYRIRGYGEVVVNYNPDLSGPAVISWKEDKKDKDGKVVEIPAKLLVELSKEFAADSIKDDVVRFIEDWSP